MWSPDLQAEKRRGLGGSIELTVAGGSTHVSKYATTTTDLKTTNDLKSKTTIIFNKVGA
jgi:outer membrane cobalamin receptor